MKLRKIFIFTLCFMLSFCLGAAVLIGCDGGDDDKITYKVTVSTYNRAHGTLTLDRGDAVDGIYCGVYAEGQKATVTIEPKEDYELSEFAIDGEDKLGEIKDGVYKFKVTKDVTIKVAFKKKTVVEPDKYVLEITKDVGENGKIEFSVTDRDKFQENESVTVYVLPDKGYEVEAFMIGETDYTKSILLDGQVTFRITENTTVKATFVEDDLTKVAAISAKRFDYIINNYDYVLVDFWATWCGACMQMKNDGYLPQFAESDLGIKVVEFNIGSDPSSDEMRLFYNYVGKHGNGNGTAGATIPSVMFFKNGVDVGELHSSLYLNLDQLLAFAQKYMD